MTDLYHDNNLHYSICLIISSLILNSYYSSSTSYLLHSLESLNSSNSTSYCQNGSNLSITSDAPIYASSSYLYGIDPFRLVYLTNGRYFNFLNLTFIFLIKVAIY